MGTARLQASRVSSFVLKMTGYGVLTKTTASVALAEGEVAAKRVGSIELSKP